MTEARKALAVVAGAVAVLLVSLWSDGEVTNAEWVMVATEGFAVLSVWVTANGPAGTLWHYAKSLTAAGLAALGLYGGYLAAGTEVTDAMWLNVAVAGLAALGVLVVPNSPAASRPHPA